jgi:hypothetical protein
VVAPGGETGNPVLSANAGATNAYVGLHGTSMAAPQVTAIVGAWCGRWDQLAGGSPCLSSTPRALAAHTARAASATPGPNFRTGYGLISAEGGMGLVSSNFAGPPATWSLPFIKEMEVWTNGPVEIPFTVGAGSTGRVTIAWTDPPGVIRDQTNVTIHAGPGGRMVYLSPPALVNDLDLRVVRVGGAGETLSPWRLDPVNYTAAATRGDNSLDTVETVEVVGPGTFTVRVTSKAAPVDGAGAPAPQPFSMILSGQVPPTAVPELRITGFGRLTLGPGDELYGLTAECVPGARLTVEKATALPGAWTVVVRDAAVSGTNVSFAIPAPEATAFFRIHRTR